MRYCKIVGNFAYNNEVTKDLTTKDYQINQNQIEKQLYVPFVHTSEERANTYKIFNENNENQL